METRRTSYLVIDGSELALQLMEHHGLIIGWRPHESGTPRTIADPYDPDLLPDELAAVWHDGHRIGAVAQTDQGPVLRWGAPGEKGRA